MNIQDYQNYIIPLAIVGFFLWRFLKFKKIKSALPNLIEQGALIVDVRTPSEFQQGSRPDSINIPLDDLSRRFKELDKKKPIILCCASGSRSGVAVGILKQNGFDRVINAGPWQNTI